MEERSEARSPFQLDPRALRLIGGLSLARVLFHLLTHRGYGIFRDELYYLACAQHLDFGYVDHPPLAPALAFLMRTLFGDSLLALRFLPALAGGATVFLAGLACAMLGGGRASIWLACLAVGLSPVLLAFGHVFSMNAFEPLFFGGCTLLLVRLAQGAHPRAWLGFGVLAGIALQNKHSMLFFGFAALSACLLTPALRGTLRTRFPWLGLAIALLLFAPNLLWQAKHGFPTLEFMHNARAHKNLALDPLAFLLEQVLQMGPLALPVWLAGLWFALTPAGFARGARPVAIVYLTLLVVFVLTEAKPYYLASAYPVLFSVGAVAIERAGRRLCIASGVAVTIGGLIALPMVVPVLSAPTYVRYAAAVGVAPSTGERQQLGALPQFYADMHVWAELARDVARAWHKLPPHEQRRCAIFGNNYGEAGAIDYFGPALGLPRAIAGHNSYWMWGPGDSDGSCVLVIGGDREDHLRAFEQVEAVGESSDAFRMPYENVTLWLLRRPRMPLHELWANAKNFI
jgi:4-amino-4-deoxy-L-arabinose transferase-like glycosyltransferase